MEYNSNKTKNKIRREILLENGMWMVYKNKKMKDKSKYTRKKKHKKRIDE